MSVTLLWVCTAGDSLTQCLAVLFCKLLQDLDGQEVHHKVSGLLLPRLRGQSNNFYPTTALLSFKSAVQAGLERRRLLALAVLSAQPGPSEPADILQHISKLAELVL